jgi:hypothetical protein
MSALLLGLLLAAKPAFAASEVCVVYDNTSNPSQVMRSVVWASIAGLSDHRRAIAVFVKKDIVGGPFFDEYSGIDMLSMDVDTDGGIIAHKYTSAQGGKMRVQRTDPITGNLTAERTVADAAEAVADGAAFKIDLKPNPSSQELIDARTLCGVPQ